MERRPSCQTAADPVNRPDQLRGVPGLALMKGPPPQLQDKEEPRRGIPAITLPWLTENNVVDESSVRARGIGLAVPDIDAHNPFSCRHTTDD